VVIFQITLPFHPEHCISVPKRNGEDLGNLILTSGKVSKCQSVKTMVGKKKILCCSK
jgi:hypothetical protein